ncbi:DNA-binding response regulator, OmpR family, contains REC and winged-helix (wHTH) domain [Seinonella peptonophila]|uniref:DNA-binding response regulator, OmpR family, contains REC and winged-helix (WHTH) domain n=1 Tax=Seinonella peptonophila TaxID=112248 RepID=A0A1M4SQL5_9BACL|nr:response regulator transcription factor [Seinonella peptonophila]SHE34481.1 DNA-binding response regulator, OmpR family, contains REC and winged-helix (wHTH) domain [Seinonella peptonophila]
MHQILIVEDDLKIARKIASFLIPYGYTVRWIIDFRNVLEQVEEYQPDLIVLDVNLPSQDGYTLCKQIRLDSKVPILFLSARSSDMEQIFGMESGGDDYLTKPFQLELLLAKVRALLRRSYGELSSMNQQKPFLAELNVNGLILRLDQMEMVYNGETISLTKNECKLLHLILSQSGKVVTREECLERLWDEQHFVDDNTLTVNVTRVRKKLARWGLDHAIETKRGVGYRWVNET